MSSARRLPGIRLAAQPEPLREVLPRMDIPVLVGFAASGPLHLPVAVDDPAQFTLIFGADVELPRPRGERAARHAHLGPCVRAFFDNGGRRCWIVRVAANASLSSFRLPGLFRVDAGGGLAPAFAFARSEGSWSDALRVRVSLASVVLPLLGLDAAGPALDLGVGSPRDVVAGDLVRVAWQGSEVALYLFVTAIDPSPAAPALPSQRAVRLRGKPLWIRRSADAPPAPVDAPSTLPLGRPAVERLSLDLDVRDERGVVSRLSGLGFTPAHPRAFGALPGDSLLFEESAPAAGATPASRFRRRLSFAPNFLGATRAPESQWPGLWRDAANPRFAVAAAMPFDGAVYVPAGMDELPAPWATAQPATQPALERDGLGAFAADLFVDPRLADAGVRDLAERAAGLRYEARQPPTGIHAAFAVEEATVLAAPDAVHLGWLAEAPGPVPAPLAEPPARPGEACAPRCPTVFADRDAVDPLPLPGLEASAPAAGTYELRWPTAAGTTAELQEATRPDFSDAVPLAADGTDVLVVWGRAPGIYYYRLRRRSGARVSGWAMTAVRVAGALEFTALDDRGDDSPALRAIHVAMLRMCTARADMVAVLSLPRHYDHRAAAAHAAALASGVEPQALGYGALWHPWLIGRDHGDGRTGQDGPLRAIPPDGATAGVLAARASARGAWVAPANVPLRGVVGLTPAIAAAALQSLQDAAVNVIRREPAGFLCLDADTLAGDDEIRPLNVRRLLILIRRAAIRTGNDYAFEPHDGALRNALRRGFEALLATMFQRGAFAGRTARQSYQVVTDESVNARSSTDGGRLIAELRIAPSRPLSFLTLRLVQGSAGAVVAEVR